MDCKETHILMIPYIVGDPDLTESERYSLEAHLEICPDCRDEYNDTEHLVELILTNREYLVEKEIFSEKPTKPAEIRFDVEKGWQDLQHRIDKLERRKRIKSVTKWAVAACVVIGVLTWSILSNTRTSEQPTLQQVATVSAPSVKIELVSQNGNILIPASQQITSPDELKTLVINGKHRMTMNINTILGVEPLVENSHIGCLVKLNSGQIYAHVEHDGNPFVVDTVHGEAVITGTTFDIKATEDSTTLVVSEGTVQFESENGVVNVTAGQTSKIVGQSTPSIPLSCNTAELTAWATGYKPEPVLAQAESDADCWYLSLPLGKEPIVLEETDYAHWAEQKRDWFKQEFPWIFQLKDALAKEDIEVDYPQLLIKSGDAWQFACLDVRPAQFSVIDPNSLLTTAFDYGFDKQWLLENVPAVKSASEKPALSENSFTGLKAFERWLDYLDETKGLKPRTPIYSYHASKYLAETRSLIWFAVRDGEYDLTDKERAEVLVLLQKEVTAAYKCQNDVLYPTDEQKKPSCYEDTYQEPVDSVIEHIETMKAVEERIAEYEIGK